MSKPPLTPQQVNEALKKHLSVTPAHYFDPITTAFHFTAGYANGYAASPQREWVGLTDEEYTELWGMKPDLLNFFRKIEAKLKEKNT